MQQKIGLPVEILDPHTVHDRWPHIEPDRIVGATWCPTDGFLFPQMIYMEGFRRAQELGVHLMQDTEVIGATLRSGRIIALDWRATKDVLDALEKKGVITRTAGKYRSRHRFYFLKRKG